MYDYAAELTIAFRTVSLKSFQRAADVLQAAYERDARVFSCGNGGSASIANHLACDHVKGIRTGTELRPRVMSLTSSVELLTAISNDIGYEDVFTYQLQTHASHGDVLIAISSRGESANICKAIRWANDHGVSTIALTGFEGGNAYQLAQVRLHVTAFNYGIVEDAHQAVMHALAQFIRQAELPRETLIAETAF